MKFKIILLDSKCALHGTGPPTISDLSTVRAGRACGLGSLDFDFQNFFPFERTSRLGLAVWPSPAVRTGS